MASPATNVPQTSASTNGSQTTAPVPAPSASTATTTEILPGTVTLVQATRLAIQQDRPIHLDYFVDTANGKAFIAEDPDSKDKVLVKSREEYTSIVSKMYKVGEDFLILTENSIYIVSGKTQKRRFPHSMLKADEDTE
jgi:hypothetical protein